MKRILLLLLTLCFFAGCANQEPTDPKVTQNANTLWVITEQSTSDGINYQAEQAAEAFESEHQNVTIRIEILPTDEEERDIYLQQLRTQIMAGNGPDVYLLPTGSDLIIDSPDSNYTTVTTVDPLFHDIEQTMRLGIFADLHSYFEADTELNTASLQREIMNAGTVDGKRYVLPLRYTMPVLLADHNNYAVQSLSGAKVSYDSAITDLVNYALDTEDNTMAAGLLMPTDISIFPTLYDYDKEEILVSVEDISQYMRLYQQWYSTTSGLHQQMIATAETEATAVYNEVFHNMFADVLAELNISISLESFNSVRQYILCNTNWVSSNLPFYVTSLSGALESAILKEGMQLSTEMYPLHGTDGSVGAEITYFGAVGASCENVELAYDYLRLFLSEDYQWDYIRPRADRSKDSTYHTAKEEQSYGLIENSWPVRAIGATSCLFDTLDYQLTNVSGGITQNKERLSQMRAGVSEINDLDMPILQADINEVRFPFYQPYEETLTYAMTLLNHEDGTPTDVDIDQLAEEVWQYLWWHLAEG